MRKIFTLIVFIVFGITISYSQTWNWATVFPSDFVNYKIFEFLTPLNNSNDFIAGGSFYGQYIEGNDTLIIENDNGIFISRIGENGIVEWIKGIKSSDYLYVKSLKTDNKGNIYLCGIFYGLELTIENTSYLNKGRSDGFIAKFDAYGNFLWVKNIGTNLEDIIIDIDIDQFGQIYVLQNIYDFNSDTASLNILKIDSTGTIKNEIVGKYIKGTVVPMRLLVNEFDEVLIAGSIIGKLNFENNIVINNDINPSAFLIQFNSDLNFLESKIAEPSYGVIDIILGENTIYMYSGESLKVDSDIYFPFYILRNMDYKLKTNWNKVINEKSIYLYKDGDVFYDIYVKSAIDTNGTLVSMFRSASSLFIFNNDTARYVTNYESNITQYFENYILAVDYLGNEHMFFNFNGDLMSSGTAITCLSNGNIITSGYFNDSIFNIGDFQLQNPTELYKYTFVHGHYFYARQNYNYLASFNVSPVSILNPSIKNPSSSILYPNPVENSFKIRWNSPLNQEVNLFVYSLSGQLISKQTYPSNIQYLEYNISDLPKGIYLAIVRIGEERLAHKFLKN